MTTYTDAKYSINLPSGTGGSWNFISSQTASNSATVSFTSGLTSTYKAYKFVFVNIKPATDRVDFQFNLSTDGGSNYNVTKTTTLFRARLSEAGTGDALEYRTDQDLAQSTAFQQFSDNTDNDSDSCTSGHLLLFNPSSTVYVKHFIARSNNVYDDGTVYSMDNYVAGYGNTTSAVNAIQFKMDSGNISAGTIYFYGLST